MKNFIFCALLGVGVLHSPISFSHIFQYFRNCFSFADVPWHLLEFNLEKVDVLSSCFQSLPWSHDIMNIPFNNTLMFNVFFSEIFFSKRLAYAKMTFELFHYFVLPYLFLFSNRIIFLNPISRFLYSASVMLLL